MYHAENRMKRFVLTLAALLSLSSAVHGNIVIGGVIVGTSDEDYLNYRRHIAVPSQNQSGPVWESGDNTTEKTAAQVEAIVAAIKQLETDPVCVEIFEKMKSANEDFVFNDIDQAKGNVRQRLRTIEQIDMFNSDKNYTYYDSYHPAGTSATDYWITGRKSCPARFRQILGTAPQAIASLCSRNTQTYGECQGALFACVWMGARLAMGDPYFDARYPHGLNMDWERNNTPNLNTRVADDTNTLVPGDTVYFKNYNYGELLGSNDIPNLRPQKFFIWKGLLDSKCSYDAVGENTVYIGRNKFEGLGDRFRKMEEDDIMKGLMWYYNSNFNNLIANASLHGNRIRVSYEGYEEEFEVKWLNETNYKACITRETVRRLIN